MALAINKQGKQGTSWDQGKFHLNTLNAQPYGTDHEEPSTVQSAPSSSRILPSTFIASHRRLAVSRIRTFAVLPGPGLSTQAAKLPSGGQQSDLRLSHQAYGLPTRLVKNFSSLGLNLLYPWQAVCLQRASKRNFVYSASTGAGKSLVADVLMLKNVLESGKKALLVLPYVALVQEKTKWLRKVVAGLEKNAGDSTPSALNTHYHDRSVRVVPFFGGSKLRLSLEDADIAVATIEKANGLINSAIEEARIDDLGVLVLDELHMIDDPHRGYLMEPLVSKIRSLEQDVQIIGMSATLSNVEDLAKWLDALWYESNYKAVPVAEYLVHENKVYALNDSVTDGSSIKDAKAIRAVEPSREKELSKSKHNAVVSLSIETVLAGYGVLVFCSSRLGCQITAELIARASPIPDTIVVKQRQEVIDALKSLMNLELDPILEQIIPMGVGFHHAGLTTEEKDIIADAFDAGVLKVLVATSSLAAGINLPARRVILQEARQGRDFVAPSMLRQMRGRAGRKGKDEIGESYVCCTAEDFDEVQQLLDTDLPPATSCLSMEKRGIKRALLEAISIRLANHDSGLHAYSKTTLLSCALDNVVLEQMVIDGLEQLREWELIQIQNNEYNATPLGQAIVAAGLEIDSGLFIHDEIQHALRHFVMDCDLHVIYLFTPINLDSTISWPAFLSELDPLTEAELRVLKFTRINPKVIHDLATKSQNAHLPENNLEDIRIAKVYQRFYVALQLKALCEETPLHIVAKRFGVSRGAVQSLSQSCHSFAASMISFCQRLGLGMLAAVLEHMVDRLRAGARSDLLELAKIPFIKSKTARALWENGYKGLRAVAEAEPEALIQVLLLAQPRKRRVPEEEEGYISQIRLRAEIVISQAQRLWQKENMLDLGDEM